MSKKKLIIIVLWILVLILIIFMVYQHLKIDSSSIPQNSNNNHGEKVSTNEDYIGLLNILFNYGQEISKNKKYLNYLDHDGVYFINLNKLEKDFNYDVSMFVDKDNNYCNKDTSGIIFYSSNGSTMSFELKGCFENNK